MTAHVQTADKAAQLQLRQVLYWGLVLVTISFIAFILFYRLDVYPEPWHDEGTYLQVAKNYAQNGLYADALDRYTGPVVSLGPTVILPIGLLFKAFGVNIELARLVVVFYGFLTLAAFYMLGRVMLNRRLAYAALLLLLLSRSLNFQYYARTVLGEVPGLFFMLAALALWLHPSPPNTRRLMAVGALFGLASVTKNQYALFILPSLLLVWILDLVWYKRQSWRYFVIPGMVAGMVFFAWTGYMLFLLGANERDVIADFQTMRIASANGFFIIRPQLNLLNLDYLSSPDVYFFTFVPAALYGLVLAVPRSSEDSQRWGIVWTFLLTSTVLFVFSVGWVRFAVPPLALVALFVGRLCYTLTDGFRFDGRGLRETLRGKPASITTVTTIIAIGWLWLVLLAPALDRIRHSMNAGDAAAYRLAEYLDANVPKDALIETWEAELAVLTDHNYHFSPQIIEAMAVKHKSFGGPPTADYYDFRENQPDYVIIGPSGEWVELFPAEYMTDFEPIYSVGRYTVYQLKKSKVVS
jgi:hypothetical protein